MFTAVFILLIQEKVIVKTYKVSSSKLSVQLSPLTSSRLWDEDDDEHDSSPAESELKRCPPPAFGQWGSCCISA